jgi:hypothetical protein
MGLAVGCKAPDGRLAPFGERSFDVINSLTMVEKERKAAIEMLLVTGQNGAAKQAAGQTSMDCKDVPRLLEAAERGIGLR